MAKYRIIKEEGNLLHPYSVQRLSDEMDGYQTKGVWFTLEFFDSIEKARLYIRNQPKREVIEEIEH